MYTTDTIELKKIMLNHHIETIKALSALTGLNRNTLGNVLNGKIRPTSNVIEKIAIGLDMDSEQIKCVFFKEKLT